MAFQLLRSLFADVAPRGNDSTHLINRRRLLKVERMEERNLLASLVVNSLGDGPVDWNDGSVTLRDALAWAADGSNPGTDEISFDDSLNLNAVAGEITLTDGQLVIDSDVTINGPGVSQLAVNADAKSRVLFVQSNVAAAIKGITLTNGIADLRGGGVYNSGDLLLSETVVANSRTRFWTPAPQSWDGGGGIFNDGALSVVNSVVRGNYSADEGGGIYNPRTGNGTIEIVNSQLIENSVRWWGGGIYSDHRSTLIRDSRISNNSSQIGSGVYIAFGSAVITNSLVTDNSAVGQHGIGAGIWVYYGDLHIVNSTISGNAGTSWGGGIDNHQGTSTLMLDNSIVALNIASTDPNISGGYAGANNVVDADPLFVDAASGDYRLTDESPAVNAGDNALALDAAGTPLQWDIRGPGYPRVVGGIVDIGALESNVGKIQQINVDVKPGNEKNQVNFKKHGVVPIAVYTTEEFDAATLDASTIRLAGVEAQHIALEDVDGDGDLDLILHFVVEDLIAALDLTIESGERESVQVELTAQTIDDALVQGWDTINFFFPGKKGR